jgi:hypothetical protein
MRKAFVLAVATAAAAVVLVTPAAGIPPVTTTVTQQGSLVNPTACGTYGVRWNINLTARVSRHFDWQGRLWKITAEVTEDNTVVNTVTGLTLRDGPVAFTETTFFDPETGRRELIKIIGTSAIVQRGDELLVDRGSITIDGQTGKILASKGPHPLRELLDGSFNVALALPGFCDILR